jgi:hypothetical protein
MGRKDERERMEEGREREGREDSEGRCPLNKNSGDATEGISASSI